MGSSKTADSNVIPPTQSKISSFCKQAVRDGVWLYFGFVVDTLAGTATFIAARGDTGSLTQEVVAFNPLASSWSLSSFPDNATVGNKNLPSQAHSSVGGLHADLAGLVLISSALNLEQVIALANEQGSRIGTVPLKPFATGAGAASANGGLNSKLQEDAVFWLNGTDGVSILRQNFPLPLKTTQDQPEVTTDSNGTSIRLCQSSSASIELPVVSCDPGGPALHASLRFKLQMAKQMLESTVTLSSDIRKSIDGQIDSIDREVGRPPTPTLPYRWTVATIGDGEAHVRVTAEQVAPYSVGAGGIRLQMECSRGGPNSTARLEVAHVVLMEWISLEIMSGASGISVNGSAPMPCGCSMGGIWAFLGEGYLYRPYPYATECVEHSLEALASRAATTHTPARGTA
jgi:hypothetical protein